ncbi:hypothetical protein E3T55_05975 [Cryobacterium frigoriphilum]|uniref:3'-kinase n=1 Tax=Cryobacterium frigoriphilum TaxID=1259150 RepID=A0A4R9A5X8_9MICO|nr:aminoglycoside phosphotransferase family protein [Cryobacterium frigoriphilum]TFD52955.1 hypothetical protein E3T55_05975 [Cryobacterium frigoriphilum]
MCEGSEVAKRYLRQWRVAPTGPAFSTSTSELIRGVRRNLPVMLKVARVDEEARGSALLEWWGGRGAVRVLKRDDTATLMLRATGPRELAQMAEYGSDAEASAALVQTVRTLHDRPPPEPSDGVPLVPLRQWFGELLDAKTDDPLMCTAAEFAQDLLSSTGPADERALHGDIHHGNVLDFGDGWAAIDPKGLFGHRAFDYANILCNPSLRTAAENLGARLDIISSEGDLDREVLAGWALAWCGLSLVWHQHDTCPSWHAEASRRVGEQLLRALAPEERHR